MAHIRTWAELQARELTPAEEQLINACDKNDFCQLVDGELPPDAITKPQSRFYFGLKCVKSAQTQFQGFPNDQRRSQNEDRRHRRLWYL